MSAVTFWHLVVISILTAILPNIKLQPFYKINVKKEQSALMFSLRSTSVVLNTEQRGVLKY